MARRDIFEIKIGMLQVIGDSAKKRSGIFYNLEVNHTMGGELLTDLILRKMVFYDAVKSNPLFYLSDLGKKTLKEGLGLLEVLFN